MFSEARFFKLANPIPPIPTPAIFRVSLGALYPTPPSTWRGTIVNAEAVKAVPFTKVLLERPDLFTNGFLLLLIKKYLKVNGQFYSQNEKINRDLSLQLIFQFYHGK
jgi:hypothetical protein